MIKTGFYDILGLELDWMQIFNCYALNNSTKEFENCSGVKKLFILSESDRELIKTNEEDCGREFTYILYDASHNKIGYVFVMD